MVSTTAWQSTPAVNPGPQATTMGASPMRVPRFFLAKMASTIASGRKNVRQAASGSASTGISPCERTPDAVSADARTAVTSSTVNRPVVRACEKQTVLRMAVDRSKSVITTSMPARLRRSAMPEARSPAPRISTSMDIPPSADRRSNCPVAGAGVQQLGVLGKRVFPACRADDEKR